MERFCTFAFLRRVIFPCLRSRRMRSAMLLSSGKRLGSAWSFQEVDQLSEAEVRIGYSTADGSSASAVGRDVLQGAV